MTDDKFLYYMIMMYILIATFWGIYSGKRQQLKDPNKITTSVVLNMFFWPIGILIAIIRFETNSEEEFGGMLRLKKNNYNKRIEKSKREIFNEKT